MSAIDKVLDSHHYLKLDPLVWGQAMSELAALREKERRTTVAAGLPALAVTAGAERMLIDVGVAMCQHPEEVWRLVLDAAREEFRREKAASVDAAVLAERERCVKIIENWQIRKGGYTEPAHAVRSGSSV